MDETHQDETGSKSIAAEDVRWVFNKRSKLWVPQHKKRKWFRRWKIFEGKFPFDWLNLIGVLAIPFVVTFLGLYATQQITQLSDTANRQQHQIDLQIATDQQRETTLKTYLDDMSDLLLNHNLRKSKPEDEVRQVARERTLTTLRRLDANRNRSVVQFLQDEHLIVGKNAIIDLSNAHLNSDDLSGADLHGADLSGADLRYADLSYAILRGVTLSGADLDHTNLNNATLQEAKLDGALFGETNLNSADLRFVDLRHANLRDSDLTNAFLAEADLSYATLRGAGPLRGNLSGADLHGANMSYVDLNGVGLDHAYLVEANLTGANLTEAYLHGADLHGADLHGAYLARCRSEQC